MPSPCLAVTRMTQTPAAPSGIQGLEGRSEGESRWAGRTELCRCTEIFLLVNNVTVIDAWSTSV
jgi:hypothetical protein